MSKYSRCLYVAMSLAVTGATVSVVRAQDANRDVVIAPNDVGGIVDRVQKLSGEFKNSFDKAISHSMVDHTRMEANAKHRADDLHDAANKLGDVFHDKKDKNNPAVREQVDRTLAAAAELNRIMTEHRFTDRLQSQWDMLRADLNGLATVYELSKLEGGPPAQ